MQIPARCLTQTERQKEKKRKKHSAFIERQREREIVVHSITGNYPAERHRDYLQGAKLEF